MELPGAITQGETLQEARENLRDAMMLVIEENRRRSAEWGVGVEVIREPLVIRGS